jgi:hypothetical protein
MFEITLIFAIGGPNSHNTDLKTINLTLRMVNVQVVLGTGASIRPLQTMGIVGVHEKRASLENTPTTLITAHRKMATERSMRSTKAHLTH